MNGSYCSIGTVLIWADEGLQMGGNDGGTV